MNDSSPDSANIKEKIIQFDSCTALMNALARYLQGLDFPLVGLGKDIPSWMGSAIDVIPKKMRLTIYSWSGWVDAMPSEKLRELRSSDIDRWVVGVYPERKYPGIMFGSANGAAVHLGAALNMPWLPQTFLTAARRFLPPDEILEDIEWGKKTVDPFLEANPDMETTQMHDPVQDRLMIQKMGYFRIKKRMLGEDYERFIFSNRLESAPLITIECRYPWPALTVSERHHFQVGGLGAVAPYEYLHGSDRVKLFLEKVGSPIDKWKTFEPSGEFPEGEWGFAESCLSDISRFVDQHNIPWVRVIFDHPEDLTPFTADLYEWWYRRRGRESETLLVENFGLVAPFDAIQSSAIPFWLAFNTQDSFQRIKKYLESHQPYNEIFLMLMSNGVPEGIGLAGIDEWKRLLNLARERGEFVGVNEREYPLDFGTFIKYNQELKQKMGHRQVLPDPLTLKELKDFYDHHLGKYQVQLKFS